MAYEEIKASGLLSGLHWEVYNVVFAHGPMTARETANHAPLTDHQLDSVRPRFAELEKMGVLTVVGERECSVTHMTATTWCVTANLPQDIPAKRKPKILWCVLRDKKVIASSFVKADIQEVYEAETVRLMNEVQPAELVQFKEILSARG